jgi:hypothetical protein
MLRNGSPQVNAWAVAWPGSHGSRIFPVMIRNGRTRPESARRVRRASPA